MKFQNHIAALVLTATVLAAGQNIPLASSHGASKPKAATPAKAIQQVAPKPALRVNGTVLTEIDVQRQMYAIFPYAQQHSGIPKDMEPEIRRGAVEMLIFEELLYQDAVRRGLTVPDARVATAQAALRKQFPDKATYDEYLRTECGNSTESLRGKIRRSLLIETSLKELAREAGVTEAAAREYFNRNPKQFEVPETISIQTISIIPPENATAKQHEEAKAKIKDIVRLGRAAKDYKEFGLIAQQISEDDWRTKLGDRGKLDASRLPPEVAKVARTMKPGQVSEPIALGRAWVVIRLNAYAPAGKQTFAQAKTKLLAELRARKLDQMRTARNRKLRQGANVEIL